MPFLPSLLEYEVTALEKRLITLKKNQSLVQKIQQSEILTLHLDFVCPEFAKNREVKASLTPEEVWNLLDKHFDEESLNLSIHFMATDNDFDNLIDDLIPKMSNLAFEQDWSGKVFVNKNQMEDLEFLSEISNFELGEWFDFGEWGNIKFEPAQSYLLMTVLAGKSGQKLDEKTKNTVLEIAKANIDSHFTFDGGWNLDNTLLSNLDIVSYSSFWQSLELELQKKR
jgi:pentose-5-phosphate-3-epimerase